MREWITVSVDTDRDISSIEFGRSFIEGLIAIDDGRLAPEFFNSHEPINRSFAIEGIDAALKLWGKGLSIRRRRSPQMLMMVEPGPPEAIKYKRFPWYCIASISSTKFEEQAEKLHRYLAHVISPGYGRTTLDSEIVEKHYFEINESDGGILQRYVGTVPETQIPSVYWLTYLGPWAIEMIGRNRIETLPVGEVERIDEGYLIKAYPHLKQSGTPEAHAAEESIKDHLGRHHFFDRSQVDIEKLKNPPHVEKAIREAAEKMKAEGKKSTTLEI